MTDPKDPNCMIRCAMQPGFSEWMRQHPLSLAVTTYQTGVKIVLTYFPSRTYDSGLFFAC